MRLTFIFLTLFCSNFYGQINYAGQTFSSDSALTVFKTKINNCFEDEDFNFTDFIVDNKYFLVAKVLTLGPPKLFVSTFNKTIVIDKNHKILIE